MTYRCFFPRGVRKAPLVLGALSRKPRWATAMAFCTLLAAGLFPLTYRLSFRQGRWSGEPRPSSFKEWEGWMAGEPLPSPKVSADFDATADGVVFGLFPDRLILPFETVVGDTLFEQFTKVNASQSPMRLFMFGAIPTRDFRGRNLQAINLTGADLRGVELEGADLRGAQLQYARLNSANMRAAQLQRAELEGAQLPTARLGGADLEGADLHAATLSGADLTFAKLTYARLIGAELQSATLAGSALQGTWLNNSHIEGANLSGARLEAADLSGAHLEGANLVGARLRGSAMRETHLLGAFLEQANLEGANLAYADLEGADLAVANLHGAQLKSTQLQGANLAGVDGSESEFDEPFVYRTNVESTSFRGAIIRSPRASALVIIPKQPLLSSVTDEQPQSLSDEVVANWLDAATKFAPEANKLSIHLRLNHLESNFQTIEQDRADGEKWRSLAEVSNSPDSSSPAYRTWLARVLGDWVCASEGAPFVAEGLTFNQRDRLAALGEQLTAVRERMEEGRNNPSKCPGVAGFTEDNWRALESIKPTDGARSAH
jgi:uncharacterized protein YjbI with pentapeptide repeats